MPVVRNDNSIYHAKLLGTVPRNHCDEEVLGTRPMTARARMEVKWRRNRLLMVSVACYRIWMIGWFCNE